MVIQYFRPLRVKDMCRYLYSAMTEVQRKIHISMLKTLETNHLRVLLGVPQWVVLKMKTVLHFLPTEKTCVSPVLLNCVDILCGWFAGEDS